MSYLFVLAALLLMRPHELGPAPQQRRGHGGVREGLLYVRHRPDIQLVMLLVFVLGTFGMNFQITNALMATAVFHKGPGEYGLLGSIMAIGSLGGALLAARRKLPRLRVLLVALAAFTVSTALASLAPSYPLFAIALVPVGLSALTAMTTANAMVQTRVEPEVRGRVMALYMAIFMGGTPVGAPVIGWIGQVWGPRWTIAVGTVAVGAVLAVVAGRLIRAENVRVTYERTRHPRWSITTGHDDVTIPEPQAAR